MVNVYPWAMVVIGSWNHDHIHVHVICIECCVHMLLFCELTSE